jgi:hypothetical protein
MPRTFTTTVAPSPTDARVLHLEQLLSVSRSQAVGVVVMSWAWMLAEESEGVVPLPVTILDKVVDIEGAGQALVDAGLVGVEPGGLILPLGVRQAADRATRKGESKDERKRRMGNDRQKKCRKRIKLTSPSQASRSKTSPPTTEAPAASRKPARLGTVEGRPIMLLFRRDGVPFYKLQAASPKDFTGTVTDPDNPSLADAFVALMSTMRREKDKGFHSGDTFRPTMEQMVAAARLERERREAAVADAARREQANQALAEASAEDQDDHDQGGSERDAVTPMSRSERDTVTSHAPVTLEGSEEVAGSPCDDRELDAISEGSKCHAPCHNAAPSSSSSSSWNEFRKENTTTTSSVSPAERDEDDILAGFIPETFVESPPTPARVKQLERFGRFADALNTTVDAVEYQFRREPETLVARLKAAGIDPRTGLPFNADGAGKPATARCDSVTTSEPTAGDKPATGIVGAPGEDNRQPAAHEDLSKVDRLERSSTTLLAARELGAEPFWLKPTGDIGDAEPVTTVARGA